MNKPKIFLSVATYSPGYRGGGPTQSIKNLVNALKNEFEFYIFTANHDLGVSEPYKEIDTDKWNFYQNTNIFYSSVKNKRKNLKRILKHQSFSLIFLNSFFDIDSILILIMRKILKVTTPVVLMPRGELSIGALEIKKFKKLSYINFAKFFGITEDIEFLTTALDEYEQVQNLIGTHDIKNISNIPNTEKKITLDTKKNDSLKIVFLSRITQKKNLDYALKTLKDCYGDISFDIYGIIEEENYWKKCLDIIESLPKNIVVNYRGELRNEEVVSTLSKYDLFYFPTKSENYGHVISEALQASIPLLISDTTPWKNLEKHGYGWDYSLYKGEIFSKKINELVLENQLFHNNMKKEIYINFQVSEKINSLKNSYIKYFNDKIT